jgi:hypothetical protein
MSLFKGKMDSSGSSDYFEYDFAIPSITQTIKTKPLPGKNSFSFGDEILPHIDKMNADSEIDKTDSYGATNREYAVRGYEDADYIDSTTKPKILELLRPRPRPRPSLSEQMSRVSLSRQ